MDLLELLKAHGFGFFTGVPDSTLQAFCWSVCSDAAIVHVPAACEGGAVGIAMGHWIATGKLPCVYMQNSGLPNAMSPLLALAAQSVYDVPMLLVVGWRGQPGIADEPQHTDIGRHTVGLLRMAGIEPLIVGHDDERRAADYVASFASGAAKRGALLVTPSALPAAAHHASAPAGPDRLDKDAALRAILTAAGGEAVIVAGIGHTSRQLMALREAAGQDPASDLLCVGAMGFASHVALGLACASEGKRIYCLDGDGSLLMHGCGTSIVGDRPGLPFTHIVLNNGCHASVGGQPVCNAHVDFVKLALSLGYPIATRVGAIGQLQAAIKDLAGSGGAGLIDVPIEAATPSALPRPRGQFADMLQTFRQKAGYPVGREAISLST